MILNICCIKQCLIGAILPSLWQKPNCWHTVLSPSSCLSWLKEGSRVGARGINFPTSCFILKRFTKALKICRKIDISPNSIDSGCQMFTHLGKCLLPYPVFSVSEPRGWTQSWTDMRSRPSNMLGAARTKPVNAHTVKSKGTCFLHFLLPLDTHIFHWPHRFLTIRPIGWVNLEFQICICLKQSKIHVFIYTFSFYGQEQWLKPNFIYNINMK